MLRMLTALCVVIAALVAFTSPAQGHLVHLFKNHDAREHTYLVAKKDYAHAKYVCIRGTGRPKRIHCRAVRWLQERMEYYSPSPPIVHLSLWQCITNGAYPGAPHEGNGYNGAYTGPLGMSTPWMGHYPPGRDWVHSDVNEVYAIAESEASKQGFSYSWMQGQWPQTYPPCVGH